MKKTYNNIVKKCLVFILTIVFFAGIASSVKAQTGKDSKGNDFWLTFPENNSNSGTAYLYISGEQNTTGNVSVPGLNFSQNFNVTVGQITTITLPNTVFLALSAATENKGIHVTAAKEVTIYGMNQRSATTDAYLGLPTDVLGLEYMVMSYQGGFNGGQIGIVSTVNNTTVSFKLTATTGNYIAGTTYSINLNQGQTFYLKNTADLTGSLITSTNPVAVFSGNQCANVPTTSFACDHLVEQMTPANTWGKNFVSMPLKNRVGDTYRFLAGTNNTVLTINGVVVATLNRGQFFEKIYTPALNITASEPILVAQYANGTSYDNKTGDPFMMLVSPYEQFLGAYTITTPATGFPNNYTNIVASTAAVGTIKLDGNIISSTLFSPIGNSGFSGAQIDLSVGNHNLISNGLPFGVSVYGFNNADSYGYPAGSSYSPIATVSTLDITPKVGSFIKGSNNCISAKVLDQFNNPVEGVRVDFSIVGVNSSNSGFANSDVNGNAVFCYTGNNSGTDVITASIGTLNSVSNVVWLPNATALNFDGQNDRVILSNPTVANLQTFTFEGWVKWNGTDNGAIYAEGNTGSDNPMFSIIPRSVENGGLEIVLRNSSAVGLVIQPAAGRIPTNVWTHVAFVRTSATTAQVYINGVKTDDLTFADPGNISVNTAHIGVRQRTGFDSFFSGNIDEVRIWNRALCQGEIQNNLNNELGAGQTGLLAYYKMNQGFVGNNNSTVNTLTDLSGNNRTGSLLNFALTGTTSNWAAGTVTGTAPTFIAPVATITANGPLTFSLSQSVVLSANTGSGLTYQWTKDGINIPSATLANYTANLSGSYNVIVRQNGCTSLATPVTVAVVDDVAPLVKVKDITVFLNQAGTASITPQSIDNGSSDNSGSVSLNIDKSTFDCSDLLAKNEATIVSDASWKQSTYATSTPQPFISVVSQLPAKSTYTLASNTQNPYNQAGFFKPAIPGAGSIRSFDGLKFFRNDFVLTGRPQSLRLRARVDNVMEIFINGVSIGREDDFDVLNFSNTAYHDLFIDNNGVTNGYQNGMQFDFVTSQSILDLLKEGPNEIVFAIGNANTANDDGGFMVRMDAVADGVPVVLTATDASGNSSNSTAFVVVKDNLAPVIASKPISVTLTTSGTVSITPQDVVLSGTDNCSPVITYTLSRNAFSAADVTNSPVTVQLTGTDASGNFSTVPVSVTVIDPVPVVITQNITVALDANGNATITPQQVDNGSSSVVGLLLEGGLVLDKTTFDCSNIGANTVKLTATSTLGSTAFATATVTVEDKIAPSQPILADLTGQCEVIVTSIPTTLDNCKAVVTGTTTNPLTYTSQGNYVITWSFNDGNGNITTATQNVIVKDDIKPVFAAINNISVNTSAASCDAVVTVPVPVATDNCESTGNALKFDGVNDYVSIPRSVSGNFTIEYWMKTTQVGPNSTGSQWYQGIGIVDAEVGGVTNDFGTALLGNRIAFGVGNPDRTIFSTVPVNTGNWVHIAATRNQVNGQIQLYVNGVLQSTGTGSTNLLAQPSRILLGLMQTGANGFYNGSLTNLRLWNTVRSASQIAANMNASVAGQTGLVANYGFNQGVANGNNSGITSLVNDASSSLNGTLNGFTLTGTNSNWVSGVSSSSVTLTNNKTNTSNASGIFPIGPTVITWTATDAVGNQTTIQQTVTVIDSIKPIVITQNATIQLDAAGNASITAADINNGSTDNCAIATIVLDKTTFTGANIGTNIVTLTVSDVNGNVSSAISTVTVEDKIAPIFTSTQVNVVVALDAINGTATLTDYSGFATATDNSGLPVLITQSPAVGTALVQNVPLTVTLTATDASGNLKTQTFTVTATDQTAPVALAQNITVQLDATGNAVITPQQVDNGSTDNVGIVNYVLNKTAFNCENVSGNTILDVYAYKANRVSGTQNWQGALGNDFRVNNPNGIVINKLGAFDDNQNGIFGSLSGGSIRVAIFNRQTQTIVPGLDVMISGTNQPLINGFRMRTISEVVLMPGDYSVVALGFNGNERNGNFLVPLSTINDGNGSITFQGTGRYTNSGFSYPTIIDGGPVNRYDAGTFSYSVINGSEVTLTVTDASGNASSAKAVVTVEDNIKPIVLIQNATIQLDAAGNASITAAAINNGSLDNCAIATVVLDKTSFTCENVGANTVTLTVTDVNGNVSSATAVVTVEDKIAPIVLTQNITIQLDAAGNASITAAEINNGSTDNCAIASVVLDKTSFTCEQVGVNTVTLTVTDVNGNVSTATGLVTVEDNIKPIVITQNATIQLDAAGNASITAAEINNGSTDNCAIATVVLDQTAFNCEQVGVNTVTLTVTDVNGNVSTATAVVTVEDNIKPIVITQNATIQLDAAGNASITAVAINNGSTDNCAIATIVLSKTAFDCSNVGANTVTLTVTDVNGNVSTATAVVTVVDAIAPIITQLAFQEICFVASNTYSLPTLTATDNCSVASVNYVLSGATSRIGTGTDASGTLNTGLTTISWTVTDVNGNVSTSSNDIRIWPLPVLSITPSNADAF
ncbi:LamG-like jellyroll fold domain-containing protein, partial [Pedobacter cryophilus]